MMTLRLGAHSKSRRTRHFRCLGISTRSPCLSDSPGYGRPDPSPVRPPCGIEIGIRRHVLGAMLLQFCVLEARARVASDNSRIITSFDHDTDKSAFAPACRNRFGILDPDRPDQSAILAWRQIPHSGCNLVTAGLRLRLSCRHSLRRPAAEHGLHFSDTLDQDVTSNSARGTMRKLLAVYSLASIASAALAQPTGQPQNTTTEHLDRCAAWGRFAELVMAAHQEGRPLVDQMKLSPDPRAYEITLEAYRTPRFQMDQSRKAASARYRDQIASECLSSLSGAPSTDARPSEFWEIRKR